MIAMAKKKKQIDEITIDSNDDITLPKKLAILPLRDIIIFPNMIYPVLIGRATSMDAVSSAIDGEKLIFVVVQKNPEVEEPTFDDVFHYGVVAKIVQVLRLPNNLFKVLLEGLFQAKIKRKYSKNTFLEAQLETIELDIDPDDKELSVLERHLTDSFKKYVNKGKNLPSDIVLAFESIQDPLHKLYYAAANIRAKLEDKQRLLEENDIKKKFFLLNSILHSELEMLEIENEISSRVHSTIQKNQRKYYIQEQIRTLQQELEDDEGMPQELLELKEKIGKANLPPHALDKANEELDRLRKTPTVSPEFSVNRTYLELLLALPWDEKTCDNLDIGHVKSILDDDHYDLEKPKERILEYIAVLNFTGSLRRQILCFVGPPGVGKTSLAKSIARALGRKFIRFSLGGVRDEAEIRGHRRTYVGALPGKIIQSMKKAGTTNPVILLDEIDKMSTDFRGDPSSALLEVLDPEQNINFNDHYLEIDYDLSNVLFITTANVKYDIPLPLLDRMEIIELNSYLEFEKLQIAKKHILPKVINEFGMEKIKINFEDKALLKLVRQYTRESGVRNLERMIASVLRKLAKELVSEFKPESEANSEEVAKKLTDNAEFMKAVGKKRFKISEATIEKYLKSPIFREKSDKLSKKIGVATGLAWTSVGGDIMPIEVVLMPSAAEKLTLTGKLGDVMKESAVAALSFIRSNYKKLGLSEGFNRKKEVHIHVPEGAIPKDGPSAGITIAVAIISAVSEKAVPGNIAMTGEITLRGNILPIGGLKEKLLAAKRIGINKVIIPADNQREIDDFADDIRDGLEIIPVKTLIEAIPHIFATNGKINA